MVDNVKSSQVWPTNELNELILTPGIGSNTVTGFVPSSQIPSDVRTGAVRAVFAKAATETVAAGETKTFYLQEGSSFTFTPTGFTGTITKYKSDGVTVDFVNTSPSAVAVYGPYSGTVKFSVVDISGSMNVSLTSAVINSPLGQSSLYKRPSRKATRQMSTRMATVANGAVGYCYHNNITVEADVVAIRPTFNNLHTAALTGVKFSVAPTANFNDPIHPTGAWIDGTSGTTTTTTAAPVARLGVEQPSLTRPDWVLVNSVAPTDGGKLRYFCVRHFVPAVNTTTSEGFYDLSTFFHVPSAANAGRIFQTFRQDVDGVGTKSAFTNTTPYGMPGLIMGWDYLLANGEIRTIACSGDSITEGIVNTGTFGAGWAWQTIKMFREMHPDVLIEYANYGIAGQATFIYQPVILERIPRVEPDLLIYSPFSCNDGTPTSSTVGGQITLNASLQTAARLVNVPVAYVSPCPNTALGWTTPQDKFRQFGKIFFEGETRMSRSLIDMDADLFDGVNAYKSGVSTDLTHPNEFGASLVAKNQGYPALRLALLGY